MNICRTCLKSPANENILELTKGIEDDKKQCVDIMEFCLDIKVTEDSKITTNLCSDCYNKIILFYKFKTLSLKNDEYLRSVHDLHLKDEKISFYVDENGVKHANFLKQDDHDPSLVENANTEIRKDFNGFSLVNVKTDDFEVKYEETFDTQTYEGHDTIEDLFYPSVSISSGPATDRCRDEGEPSIKEENIKSKNVKKSNGTATKCKKYSSKERQIQAARKVKDLKEDGKMSQGPHTCEQCGITVIDIKSHMLTHKSKDERTMLKCKACPKLFVSRGGRRRHFNIHHLGRQAKCDICNGYYVHLDTHIKQVHKKDELRFACVACGRRFVSRPVLDQHMYTHDETKDKQFKCDLCPKKYASKTCLRDHIKRTHEHIRNYQCEHCNKTFYARSELINHVRMHTMERPFECGECGKAFTWRRALVSHMLVHSGIRDFKCQLCDHSCRSASDLKTHMITHTKEKRYSCQYCGKRFGRADSCRRHEAGHQKQPAVD